MSNPNKEIPAPQVAIVLAMVVAFFGPGFLVVTMPRNTLVDFLFGGPQIILFWIVSLTALHLLEKKWLRKRHRSRSDETQ
jgi:hypothetical protein